MPTPTTTTRTDRRGRLVRVALVVAYLRGGWRSGQQIMAHVEMESERAGQPTAYNNVQGATRNAKLRALLGGLCWQYMDVNDTMDGDGSAFRLWTITEEAVPRPHVAWQSGKAEVVMLTGDPQRPTERKYRRPDLSEETARTDQEVERRRAEEKGRERKGQQTDGQSSPHARHCCGETSRPTSHDGNDFGQRPEPEGEQRRLSL